MEATAMKYYDVYLENESGLKESDLIVFDGTRYTLAKTNCSITWPTINSVLTHLKNLWSAMGFSIVSVVAR